MTNSDTINRNDDDVESDLDTIETTTDGTTDTDFKSTDNPEIVTGVAAILAAVWLVVGVTLYRERLGDLVAVGEEDELSAVAKVEFIRDHEITFYCTNIVLYIVFGFAQLLVTIGITNQQTHTDSSYVPKWFLSYIRTLGILWSSLVIAAGMIVNVGAYTVIHLYEEESSDPTRSTLLWETIHTIFIAIGGGNEVVGALWVVGIVWIWKGRTSCLVLTINGIGCIAGLAGIVSIVPTIEVAAAYFGVGMIGWYLLVGTMFLLKVKD